MDNGPTNLPDDYEKKIRAKEQQPGSTSLEGNLYEPGGIGTGTGGGRFEYVKPHLRDQALTLVDDIIGVVPGVLKPKQCEHIVKLCSQYYGPKKAQTYKGGSSEELETNREDTDRKGHLYWISYLDEPWILDNYVRPWIHDYNKNVTKFDIDWFADHDGQLCRYDETGDWFEWHRDAMLDTYQHLGALKGDHTVRKLSISLQLSQHGKDYDGCELLVGNIRPQEDDPILQQGTLIIFPSWVQHKVTKLISGTRWSWTYWFTGPPWK